MLGRKEQFHGSDLEKMEQHYGVKKADIINFAGNVNSLGISNRLRESLADHIDAISTYPERNYLSLRQSIASYVQSDTENIMVGNGSTELISLFIQIIHPNKTLILGPTYSEYEREASLGGGRAQYVELKETDCFQLDMKNLEKELKSGIDMFILCNPNNPTSSLVTRDEVRHVLDICKQRNIFVMIDETYVEFAENTEEITAVPLTEHYGNLAILRGISKFFAAPGLRLGYAICGNHDLLKEMNQRKNPWTINSLASIAGEIMFSDKDFIKKSKDLISNEKRRICNTLGACGKFKIYKPHANFVLIRILSDSMTSTELFERAIRQNLMIRDCSTFPYLSNKYIRFCFMLPEQNDKLMAVLMDRNAL